MTIFNISNINTTFRCEEKRKYVDYLNFPSPNLKNLSRGLDMVGSTLQIVFNISRFKPALN